MRCALTTRASNGTPKSLSICAAFFHHFPVGIAAHQDPDEGLLSLGRTFGAFVYICHFLKVENAVKIKTKQPAGGSEELKVLSKSLCCRLRAMRETLWSMLRRVACRYGSMSVPVRRRSASRYLSAVFSMTSSGSFGAGGVLFQGCVSSQSRMYCLSKLLGEVPTS